MDSKEAMRMLIEKHQLTEKRTRNGYQLLSCDNTVVFEVRGRMKKVLAHTWRYLRSLDLVYKTLNKTQGTVCYEYNYSS